jgi:hypothetical protein
MRVSPRTMPGWRSRAAHCPARVSISYRTNDRRERRKRRSWGALAKSTGNKGRISALRHVLSVRIRLQSLAPRDTLFSRWIWACDHRSAGGRTVPCAAPGLPSLRWAKSSTGRSCRLPSVMIVLLSLHGLSRAAERGAERVVHAARSR